MKRVSLIYRVEGERGWSAFSPEVPGYRAFGDDYADARRLALEGLPFFLGEPVTVEQELIRAAAPPVNAAAPERITAQPVPRVAA
jgi:predicted RNase H-like HicB family nuclease